MLESFTVPSSVSTLGRFAFSQCSKLASVTFESPSHLTNIPCQFFSGCHLLQTLKLPDSVTTIACSAFTGSRLTSVTGAGCVIAGPLIIRHGTILRCIGSPSKVVIPSTVREIGERAFHGLFSLEELRFEEGLVRIGIRAFGFCRGLQSVTFPASLQVIGESAFAGCNGLRSLRFASESQLQCIETYAFMCLRLETVILPATVQKISLSAFDQSLWPLVQFDGPPPLCMISDFVCSPDARILLGTVSEAETIVIPAGIEVIDPGAFSRCSVTEIVFESGTRLREIGEAAFARRSSLKAFRVPSSVETIGRRCFEMCCNMTTITFEDFSELKRIGENAFSRSGLRSITIPASTEEIDGSAFVGCPMLTIAVASGNRNFIVEGNLLLVSDGTEIVRYFGQELEIVVPARVEILRKSSFEECNQIETFLFENGSKLRRIGPSALSNCSTLRSISVPASVEIIEEGAFKSCIGLESCLIAENANLVRIEAEAFSGCHSLRSFYVPESVQVIGMNCFSNCRSLHRVKLQSGESLHKFVGDSTLTEALETVGLGEVSSLLIIELEN
jgi:hypothetical protein